jgi:hypothetical protein
VAAGLLVFCAFWIFAGMRVQQKQRQDQKIQDQKTDKLILESAPIFRLKQEAKLEAQKKARQFRAQAAFFKTNAWEDQRHAWVVLDYGVQSAIDKAETADVSTTNVQAIWEAIKNNQTGKAALYMDGAFAWDVIAMQLQATSVPNMQFPSEK